MSFGKLNLPVFLAVVFLLSNCTSATFPIQIKDVDISPAPAVGKTVELTVTVESSEDEPDVTLHLDFLEEFEMPIVLMSGENTWNFRLKAGVPREFSADICVAEAGIWALEAAVVSQLKDGNQYGDLKVIRIQSDENGGRIVESSPRSLTPIVPVTPYSGSNASDGETRAQSSPGDGPTFDDCR
jgi:hypothetical protein